MAGKQTPQYPVHIDLELTSRCQLKCFFCPQANEDKGFPIGDMHTDVAENILLQMAHKASSVKFNWRGEPFLHKDIIDIIATAKKAGYVDIMVNTNGQANASLYLQAVQAGLNTMVFSIDSLDEPTFKKIRVGGSLHKAVHNAIACKIWGCKRVTINARQCEYNANEDWIKFRRFFEFYGIKVNIRPATWRTNKVEKPVSLIKRKNCLMANRRVLIDFEGKAHPCCADWKNELIIGNADFRQVGRECIEKIWQGHKAEHLRMELENKDAFKSEPCKSCFVMESYKK